MIERNGPSILPLYRTATAVTAPITCSIAPSAIRLETVWPNSEMACRTAVGRIQLRTRHFLEDRRGVTPRHCQVATPAVSTKQIPFRSITTFGWHGGQTNVQRNRAATARVDFKDRRIRRSGSRNCSSAVRFFSVTHREADSKLVRARDRDARACCSDRVQPASQDAFPSPRSSVRLENTHGKRKTESVLDNLPRYRR